MKNFFSLGAHLAILAALLLSLLTVGKSLRLTTDIPVSLKEEGSYRGNQNYVGPKGGAKEEVGMELYPTGSSMPDCSHACGPCIPCKRVMVSFKCAVAESCPVVYRCMCKGKYYHVPSN